MISDAKIPTFEEAMKLVQMPPLPELEMAIAEVKSKPSRKSRLDWNANERAILFQKHKELGNRWTAISKFLPNKTENIIKNFYYSSLRKLSRKVKKGIFPKFDDPKCVITYEQCLHLLDYIIETFTPETHASKSKRRDSYLLGMLDTKELSIEKIETYKVKLSEAMQAKRKDSVTSVMSSFLIKSPSLIPLHNSIQKKFNEVCDYIRAREFQRQSLVKLGFQPYKLCASQDN
jgi:hypothetical protein